MPAKLFRLTVAIVAIAALVGAVWLAVAVIFQPKPTAFGWPATMTTLAGNGERGFADGTGPQARFSDPFGLAIDDRGTLYVADAGESGRIRRIEPDGRTSTLPGVFDTPSGLAVDGEGNVYVAETGANRIRRIGRDGTVTTLAGDGTAGFRDGPAGQAQFNGPLAVAVGKDGAVYVADTYNDRIRLITPRGEVETLAGGAAPGFADGIGEAAAFNTPCGLALAADGALLIADTGNDAVRRLGKDGTVTTLARAAPDDREAVLRSPVGLAATADGYVYVASFRRGRILERSPNGALRILVGRDASVAENRGLRLARPAGLAIDRKGGLYVAETASYAIRKLARRRRGETGVMPELAADKPALLSAASVPWPLAPQDGWHEVVGGVGEVRGAPDGEARDHLHAGLDVRADVGQTVLAMADETVESPLAAANTGGLSENLQIDQLTYVHLRVGRAPSGEALDPARFQLMRDAAGKVKGVRVKRGTRFKAGDPLGTVNGMAHVHVELGARGDANPIALALPGLTDHFTPRIRGVQIFDASGRRLTGREGGRLVLDRAAGPFSIVVDAFDQVDGNEARRRLGLYRAGYQILNADRSPAKGFEQPLVTIEFDRLPADPAAVKIAYAPDSGETVHGAAETRFLYVVTNRVRAGLAETGDWRAADLAPGDYTVRILAADFAGNAAIDGRDLPIRIR